MNICPVCALTGHIVELLQVVRVIEGPNLTGSVEWKCTHCRTTGHHPKLRTEHTMASSDRTVTVKLVLDTTEWDAALARVKAALAELADTRIGVRLSKD